MGRVGKADRTRHERDEAASVPPPEGAPAPALPVLLAAVIISGLAALATIVRRLFGVEGPRAAA